jgi:hypothetical protein
MRMPATPIARVNFITSLLVALLGAITAGACGGSNSEPQVIVVPGAESPNAPGASSSGIGTGVGTSTGATSGGSVNGTGAASSNSSGATTTSADGGGAAAASGVPCNVAQMLAANCTGCHSDPPTPGALAGLVTYADLMATSHEAPSQNEAQLSLSRMQNSSSPMPPGGLLPAADATILQNWISAGYPKGSCGTSNTGSSAGGGTSSSGGGGTSSGGGHGTSSGTGSGTSSGTTSSSSGSGAADSGTGSGGASVFSGAAPYALGTTVFGHHNAGQDCMSSCHNHGFTVAGTVFGANGVGVGGAEVRVVDANGNAISIYTDNSGGSTQGNFYSSQPFVGPAHVGVRNATSTQLMVTAIQSTAQAPAPTGGACNACHCTGTGCTVASIHLP